MRKTLEEELEGLYDKGFDRYKVERFTESAAMKASPMFQMLGIEYGDRIPGMYKLAETIQELLVGVIDKKDDEYWAESGGFRVEIRRCDDEPTELKICYVLADINLNELIDNNR